MLAALWLLATPAALLAQGTGSVRGTVVDAATQRPLSGVQVVVQGSTLGVLTDAQGAFQIANVPAGARVVRASMVGYAAREERVTVTAGQAASVSFALTQEAVALEELVVTALGIERQARSLTTSVQQVGGEQLTEARDPNLVAALSGKVSGVTITNSNSPGGSSRIVIRGANSLTGNNQPLFVVDGVPVSNAAPGWSQGSSGYSSIIDYGNAIQDINPNDIESISVLKGPNAAALYGSRAANGAVLITTKSGRRVSRAQISASANVSYETPLKLPEYQNLYGQGSNGQYRYVNGKGAGVYDDNDESWGPRLDGRTMGCTLIGSKDPRYNPLNPFVYDQTVPCTQFFSNGQAAPWVPSPNNVRDFFETGRTVNTSASFATGSETSNVRLSLSRMDQDGMYPGFRLARTNVALNGGSNLTDRLRTDASVQYIKSDGKSRPGQGYGEDNPMWQFLWFGRQVDTKILKAKRRNDDGTQFSWNSQWSDNPYWTAYENGNNDGRDRIIGSASASYDFTSWLSGTLRSGTDWYQEQRRQTYAAGTKAVSSPTGAFGETNIFRRETNTDFMLSGRWDQVGPVSLNVDLGGNRRDNNYRDNAVYISQLVVPGIYTRGNSAVQTPSMSDYRSRQRVNSLYGSARIGFHDYWYADLTGRNDWSSTLPAENNSYFYPSIASGFILTDAFPALENRVLSYAKVRAAWAKVANDAAPYQLVDPYGSDVPFNGAPRLTASNTLRNANLKPETTQGWEVGTELKFLDDRVSLEAAYYNKATINQIIPLEISPMTGFTSRYINAGKLSNRGIELMADVVPVRLANGFEWNVTANYTQNRDRVDELYGGLSSMVLGTYYSVSVEARKGERYGNMYGRHYVRDSKGNIVVGSNGLPLNASTNPVKLLGNYNPDWTGSLNNRFSYKGLDLSVLLDTRQGGVIYSLTNAYGRRSGILIETLEGRENSPFDSMVVKGVKVVNGDTLPNDKKVTAQQYHRSLTGLTEQFTYDASFIKLRELRLGYDVPKPWARRMGVSGMRVAVVGRNLWLKSDVPHIDPETAFNASNVQGFEYSQIPSARSFGFNLSVTP
jgi:TonB-linked SusC/RagA family outer membrane protein